MMMGLNVLKEQPELGRLQTAMGGDRRGLVVTASGSQDRGEPYMVVIQRVGGLPAALGWCPGGNRLLGKGPEGVWDVGDTVNRLVLGYPWSLRPFQPSWFNH